MECFAEKFADGFYRLLWKRRIYVQQEIHDIMLSGTAEVNLIDLGIDESYIIHFSASKTASDTHDVYLTVTLNAFDEKCNSFEARKVTGRFSFSRREMQFFSNHKAGHGNKIFPAWKAQWDNVPNFGCPKCSGSLGTGETFEILIEMGPGSSVKQEQPPFVLRHLFDMWQSKALADVTFRCDNRDIEAHTQIVSSGSPVLAAMFQNDFKEKSEKIVVIKEIHADVFEMLLYFIYTGDKDFNCCDVAELLVAADMYNVDSLKKECISYLSKNITLEEATNYLILSDLYGAEELFHATLNYMQLNSEAICSRPEWAVLLKDHLGLGLTALQFMVKKDVKESKNATAE